MAYFRKKCEFLYVGCFIILFCFDTKYNGVESWNGHNYWNSRYSGRDPDWVDYTTDETENCMFSDEGNYLSPYQFPSNEYSGTTCSGCLCDDEVLTDCSGTTITLKNQLFTNITAGTFTNANSTTEITILRCPDFHLIERGTFDGLTALTKLVIQETAITVFPDISKTSMEILNLVGNKIYFSTSNYRPQTLPSTLTHVGLMRNEIGWVPDDMFSRTNVKCLSFATNLMAHFPNRAFEDMPELIYLGVEDNSLSSLAVKDFQSLALAPKLQQLNISNNVIDYIEKYGLSLLTNLMVLEVHQNEFTKDTMHVEVFHNMPKLLHLDLNNNKIGVLPSKTITELPKLITLRLHSQRDGGMTAIEFDAFRNIGQSLENFWFSDNAFTTFPHQVLSQESYPAIRMIRGDSNRISNVTEFGREAYPEYMYMNYESHKAAHTEPFRTLSNLRLLYLHDNNIASLGANDLCQLPNLNLLQLDQNELVNSTVHVDVFNCTRNLQDLYMGSNRFQYVPEAVQSADRLPSIHTLRLSYNDITFISDGHFSNLSTLTQLELNDNDIISIENSSFPDGIEFINLNDNHFRFLHEGPFSHKTSLSSLDLSGNFIDIIPDNAFEGCTGLRTIDLSGNHIARIMRPHFRDTPLSGNIYLQDNLIAYIEEGSFSNVASTGDLYVCCLYRSVGHVFAHVQYIFPTLIKKLGWQTQDSLGGVDVVGGGVDAIKRGDMDLRERVHMRRGRWMRSCIRQSYGLSTSCERESECKRGVRTVGVNGAANKIAPMGTGPIQAAPLRGFAFAFAWCGKAIRSIFFWFFSRVLRSGDFFVPQGESIFIKQIRTVPIKGRKISDRQKVFP